MTDQENQTESNSTQNQTPEGAIDNNAKDSATETKMVTLSETDYKNIISQRDSSNNRFQAIEQYLAEEAQSRDINDFLASEENKKKFPDVKADDLKAASSPEEFEKIAVQTQNRIEEAVQAKLADIEKAPNSGLSPEDRAAREKSLKQQPGSKSFQEMLKIRSQIN